MHIAQTRLSIATRPREIKEITAEVAQWTERQRISVGLLTLYIPHTSASLLIRGSPRTAYSGFSTQTSMSTPLASPISFSGSFPPPTHGT